MIFLHIKLNFFKLKIRNLICIGNDLRNIDTNSNACILDQNFILLRDILKK